jgi:hypothetical protein
MGPMKMIFLSAVLLSSMQVPGAIAAQITLTTANVVGGSGSYGGTWDAGTFNAKEILDQQTGPISEPAQQNYWLNPDNGPVNPYIVVDLGAAYRIGSLELFNTHNAQHNDRGTGNFQIRAGNAVTSTVSNGLQVTGPTVVLVSGTLLGITQANDPIDSQTFGVSNNNQFRYLVFEPLSVAVGGAPCCGSNVYGLDELRVFDAPLSSSVPEPGTFSLMSAAGAALLWRARRR